VSILNYNSLHFCPMADCLWAFLSNCDEFELYMSNTIIQ